MRFYWVGRAICASFLRTYFREKVEGVENVPKSGAFVLTANHVSAIDPPVLGVACPRMVHFMAKAELFKMPLLSFLMPWLETFPVNRGAADRSAIRHALEVLAKGEAVGVFPEGHRSRTGELLAPQGGAAMLALKAGVPVIPAAICGTDRLHTPWPTKVKVRFGQPILLGKPDTVDKESVANGSKRIMQAIAALLDECRR